MKKPCWSEEDGQFIAVLYEAGGNKKEATRVLLFDTKGNTIKRMKRLAAYIVARIK